MAYRTQRHWGWSVAVAWSLSGAGAGSYLFAVAPFLIGGADIFLPGVVASALLVPGSVAVILAGESSIRVATMALANQNSPVARGAAGLACSTFLAVLTGLLGYVGMGSVLRLIAWPGAVAALFTMVYPGLVLASIRAVPFWSGATPAFLFLSAGLLSGGAVITVIAGPDGLGLRAAMVWLLVVCGIILVAHVAMSSQGLRAGRASARELLRGRLLLHFWIGAVLVGIAIPLVLYAAAVVMPNDVPLRAGSILILAGGLWMRYCILAGGVKISLLPENATIPSYWFNH